MTRTPAFLVATVAASLGAGSVPARADSPKAVVFAVEGVELPSTAQTKQRLAAATTLLRDKVAAAGVTVVDTAPQAAKIAANLPLHECNGCDEDIAKALGADLEVTAVVRQASSAIYDLSGSVKDLHTGHVLRQGSVDVHGDSPDEWAHAVKFLAKERLLTPPLDGGGDKASTAK